MIFSFYFSKISVIIKISEIIQLEQRRFRLNWTTILHKEAENEIPSCGKNKIQTHLTRSLPQLLLEISMRAFSLAKDEMAPQSMCRSYDDLCCNENKTAWSMRCTCRLNFPAKHIATNGWFTIFFVAFAAHKRTNGPWLQKYRKGRQIWWPK